MKESLKKKTELSQTHGKESDLSTLSLSEVSQVSPRVYFLATRIAKSLFFFCCYYYESNPNLIRCTTFSHSLTTKTTIIKVIRIFFFLFFRGPRLDWDWSWLVIVTRIKKTSGNLFSLSLSLLFFFSISILFYIIRTRNSTSDKALFFLSF